MTTRKLNLIIIWQLALTCLFLLGWTYTLKTNTPAGTDNPTEADDRIREGKGAFVERLDVDHYFYRSATSTYDAADTGKHRFVVIRDANDISSVDDDEFVIQTKEVGGIKEIHLMDEDENEFQLTSAGSLNIVSADLLGTLANNTYFTAVDNAGTGTVDLIKADANDVAVVPDNSQTATNAAPTSSTGIANRKFVLDTPHTSGIVQIVNVQSSSFVSCTTKMPCDDTVPQKTEGTEVMTLAITPTSATNKLKIEVIVQYATQTNNDEAAMALFQDTTADALKAGMGGLGNYTIRGPMTLTHYMTAGTTSETTFKVRMGAVTGNAGFNGITARRFGGVCASSITITEIKV